MNYQESTKDSRKIHNKFLKFYENRLNSTAFSNINPRFKSEVQDHTFKPHLNKISSQLAEKSRMNRSYLYNQKTNTDFLVTEQQKLQEK